MIGWGQQNGLWIAACVLAALAPLLFLLPGVLNAFSPPPLPTLPASSSYQDHFGGGPPFRPVLLLPLLGLLAFAASPIFAVTAWRREGRVRRRTGLSAVYLTLSLPALALLLNVLGAL